ncbi:uncharacterized protein SPPG_01167 [Spizellomyces punctatus DAOM BR117]|uniref:Sulfur carrier protein MOCS2A n=1 Tax=Spizellomyces punctatus (strain DAOM BR117) TaxID=645134 RepID=A0A0L0HQN6_SPIPD|nr:uncharacterized protein SPPG_01167 [Spizellomyces punctatus DAOM BR117]KND03701.1 hypothetical protein SPPG_01167 [Spizellomyces punctatus DAOM BR117]|eukprot:XP_016611740.1 hypothetical protein SPPG_01167 [Spizellomyces punctatus DAOM BR117]
MASPRSINVLYFAGAKDASGVTEEIFEIPPGQETIRVPQLIQALSNKHPPLLKVFEAAILAVNMEYVDRDGKLTEGEGNRIVEVKAGDEVAIIPPLSGG